MNKKLFKQLSRCSAEDNLNHIYEQVSRSEPVLRWCVNAGQSRIRPVLYVVLASTVMAFVCMLALALNSWFESLCFLMLVSTLGLPVMGMFIWYLARMLLIDCCELDTETGKLTIYRNGRLRREFDLRNMDVVSYSYTPPNRGGHTTASWYFELSLIRQFEGMFSLLRHQHAQPVFAWLSPSYDEFSEREQAVDVRISALQQFLSRRCGLRMC